MENKDNPFIFETADDYSYGLLKQYAKENRLFMTEAEHALWNMLRGKSLGVKFRRQHIIGDYIADFANLYYKLIIEIDGKYHFKGEQPVSDAVRTADLNKMGYTVVRFTNEEVLGNPNQVLFQIKDIINNMDISRPSADIDKITSTSHLKGGKGGTSPSPVVEGWRGASQVRSNAWAVDAACSGNPGPMEYQGVDLQTGAQVFHFGPTYNDGRTVIGTNNIGEFLAIVHALALMDKRGITDKTIYSDSYNAILWVRNKHCKTKLERNDATEPLFAIIARAEQWLRVHPVRVPIIQWQTKGWGDIPADFGRK